MVCRPPDIVWAATTYHHGTTEACASSRRYLRWDSITQDSKDSLHRREPAFVHSKISQGVGEDANNPHNDPLPSAIRALTGYTEEEDTEEPTFLDVIELPQ